VPAIKGRAANVWAMFRPASPEPILAFDGVGGTASPPAVGPAKGDQYLAWSPRTSPSPREVSSFWQA
jgi:hypothetical protein